MQLKLIKNEIYLQPEDYEKNSMLSIIHGAAFDHAHKLWKVLATSSTYRNLLNFKADLTKDLGIAEWIHKLRGVLVRLNELQKGLTEESRPVKLPDIRLIKPPFKHQVEALGFCLNMNKSALWLSMGLGKTYTAINLARFRTLPELGNIKKVIVVAPRSLIYQWEQEITTLAPEAKIHVITGTTKKKFQTIQEIKDDEFSFSLITYESICNLAGPLSVTKFDMFILDESTKIKNPKAIRTKTTVDLCKGIKYGLELTGLAYVSSPLDLYSQFLALDPTVYGTNQYRFSNHYIDYGKAPFGKFIRGYKHLDELKRRAYFLAFSRSKEQCLDLPEKSYNTRKLPLYDTQVNWYNNLTDQILNGPPEADLFAAETENDKFKVTVTYTVAMLEKLLQVTSGFIRTDEGEYVFLDSPKYEELQSIVQNSDDVFIVWARHTYVLNHLKDFFLARKINCEVLDRRSGDGQRLIVKDKFKKGQIKVLILQLQSECRGNDFTCQTNSVTSVFFESTASVEERMQAEDRCHRIGMRGTALYIDLVCEDTYDEGIQLLLKSKYKISKYIKEQQLGMLLGRGGYVTARKSKSKKKLKSPDEVKKPYVSTPLTDDDGIEW